MWQNSWNKSGKQGFLFFFNKSEIEDFRLSFAQTEGSAFPAHHSHSISSVTCCEMLQDQEMEPGGSKLGKSSPSSQTETEISSRGQSQRAEEAPCLGTQGANFWLDPASQVSAKSSVNLSSVLLKLVFLFSLIDSFILAPSDRTTVHRQKGNHFSLGVYLRIKHFVGCCNKWWFTRIKDPAIPMSLTLSIALLHEAFPWLMLILLSHG